MNVGRRTLLKLLGALGLSAAVGPGTQQALARARPEGYPDAYGVLVDLTQCIGCRRCEWRCNEVNGLSDRTLSDYEDKSVFEHERRTHADAYTVVNRYANSRTPELPVFVKQQCMHCNEPACASVCFVKAFTKTPTGAVVYDPDLCMGCRYCMAACPFNIPAYQYDDAFTPQVTKCTLCFERISKEGGVPACVEVCPVEALTFGRRADLLERAHARIWAQPAEYVDHVYGENEVGGTSWLYLSAVPFDQVGFRTDLGETPIPELGRGFLSVIPVVLMTFPLLLMLFRTATRRRKHSEETSPEEEER